MYNKTLAVLALIAASTGLGGCATVLNGTNQPVDFNTDPDGATIELVSGQSCTTPCSYELKRGNDNMVTISRAGYQDVVVYMQSRTGGSVVGNVLAGGIIGGALDASNGASNHLYPNPVYVRLVANGQSGDAMLLDKNGEVIRTVADYNASVEADVREGLVGQGIHPSEPSN